MRSGQLAPTTVALILTLGLSAAAAAGPLTGELDVRHPPDGIVGDYVLGDDGVAFSAARQESGLIAFRVEVNGLGFDATYHPAGPALVLDGQGRKLPVPERGVLRQLVRDLERSWDPYRPGAPAEERLLFNLVLLLSEAPAGFVFDEMLIAPDGAAAASVAEGQPAAPQGCEVEDDDDTAIACAPHVGPACHDACDEGCDPQHTLECRDENLGCDAANECLGRCGAGCSDDGTGKYRQDCADHDSCCRIHGGCINPLDDCCGDEYFEAADDFVFAPTNCTDCLDDCLMQLTLERDVVRPGHELAFEVYLHHRRSETVRQAFRMRLVAPDGSVVAVKSSPEREIAQGDEIRVVESLPLPADLPAGTYELMVGMDGMEQGLAVRSATVVVAE